jgi:hypothetical protein
MSKADLIAIEKKLDTVIQLLQHSLALQLAKDGVTQGDIGKHIHVAKATVVKMLNGVKREK